VLLSSDSDSDVKREQSRVRRRCLLIFYSTRKDVFSYFCEKKLITSFRFDRPSIEYITGIITLFNIQSHWKCSKIFLVSFSGIELIAHLLPKIRKTKVKRNLCPLDMVLVALKLYATGTLKPVVSNVLCYSQSSVSRSINAVYLALSLISRGRIPNVVLD
jgi:hypothetical protein